MRAAGDSAWHCVGEARREREPSVQQLRFLGDAGCAVSVLRSEDPQLIPVPFPLFQGLIVLGEASPPDPAADDASRPFSAEVKLEPGADRLVSASSRRNWVQILHAHRFWVGRVDPLGCAGEGCLTHVSGRGLACCRSVSLRLRVGAAVVLV